MKFVDGTRNRKKHVQVDIPFTVREYSSYMGGVDLLDCFLCKYMCPSEVYKEVYAALLETLTMVLINDWLLYCRVRQSLSLLQKSVLKRRNFQQVASALIEVNTAKKKNVRGHHTNRKKPHLRYSQKNQERSLCGCARCVCSLASQSC